MDYVRTIAVNTVERVAVRIPGERSKMPIPSFPDEENSKLTELYKSILQMMMLEALRCGNESVEISAGELHGRVQGPSGSMDRMPDCCQAMLDTFAPNAGDVIVEEPPARQPAKLRIKYVLPRPT
jgi:hypothetical protein